MSQEVAWKLGIQDKAEAGIDSIPVMIRQVVGPQDRQSPIQDQGLRKGTFISSALHSSDGSVSKRSRVAQQRQREKVLEDGRRKRPLEERQKPRKYAKGWSQGSLHDEISGHRTDTRTRVSQRAE